MKKDNLFHILIPVFNENETIIETVKNILINVKYNFEILICYDFEEDKTLNILKAEFPNHLKIKYVKNKSRGYNSALITGIESSNADAVLIYMADDHTNSKIINEIFKKFNDGFDVVCPSRFIKDGGMKGGSFLKSLLTKIASKIIYNFSSFPIKDATNSFRLFSKELLNEITFESDKGFTLSFEITAKAHRLNYKMIEIPTLWIERTKGESRFNLLTFIPLYTRWLIYIFSTSIIKIFK
tara:strand:- start:3051 stop:3770 length:720 start_codon:yes stop_codon:yes gene_type:complete